MMTSIFSGQTYHNSDADLAHCKKNGTFEIAGKTDYPLTIVNTCDQIIQLCQRCHESNTTIRVVASSWSWNTTRIC